MSRPLLALAAAAAFVMPASVCAQTVTRIETKPVYGATMTVEKGVRVWRGLPSAGHIIVNPGRVPISLNYNYSTVLVDGPLVADGDGGTAASPRISYGWGGGLWGGGFGRYGAKRHHVGLIRMEPRPGAHGPMPSRGPRVIHRAPHR